jgi:protein involved in polysaccharide export with SLBB domain
VVSELKEFVYVHGAVRNPGSYPFLAGYRVADYIGLAGGTAETANLRSAKIIHRDTGKSAKGPEQEVYRGDTIFIPASSRKTAGDYLTFLTQAATITFAVVAAINTINTN